MPTCSFILNIRISIENMTCINILVINILVINFMICNKELVELKDYGKGSFSWFILHASLKNVKCDFLYGFG